MLSLIAVTVLIIYAQLDPEQMSPGRVFYILRHITKI